MSRSCLDWESRSRQFEKRHLDSRGFLDSLKNNISTVRKPSLDSLDYPKNWDFLIFVEISIVSLDLDNLKNDISTVEIFSTVWKTTSLLFENQVSTVSITLKIEISWFLLRSQSRVSISTIWKTTSRQLRFSRQFEKWHLDMSRHLDLDLDCSGLSRTPTPT